MKLSFIAWLFTAIFVTLKLTGHIDWSWWLVFSPIWGYAILFGLINALFLAFFFSWQKFDPKGFDRWQLKRTMKKYVASTSRKV